MHNRAMAQIVERTKRNGSKVWQVIWRESDTGRLLGEAFDSEAAAEVLKAELNDR